MLANTGELVASAAGDGVGVGAFNVITLEHAEAIVEGAARVGVPAILQISENAIGYHGGRAAPLAAACVALAQAAPTPISVHLDHIEDAALARSAADLGVSSVMFDASTLDYADNVAATAEFVRWAHALDLWVEAELGAIGGKDGAIGAKGSAIGGQGSASGGQAGAHAPGARTDPDEARAFVAATGVDALAVAVGSTHAMTTRTATLDHDLIAALAVAVDVPLVLHGSSGLADDELRRAVAGGLTKINIGTLLNRAFTASVRAALAADPKLVDPRRYLGPARDEMAAAVAEALLVITGAS
jgi:fructose-bisphosphate aldolase, class II